MATSLFCYADLVVALIAARNVNTAQLRLDRVMQIVNEYIRDHWLSLALSKKKFVVPTKNRIQRTMSMPVGDLEVNIKPTAINLAVVIESKYR